LYLYSILISTADVPLSASNTTKHEMHSRKGLIPCGA